MALSVETLGLLSSHIEGVVILGADSASTDALSPFISAMISLGGFGFTLLAILTGFLYTRGAYNELRADRDAWRIAYEKERDAHLQAEEAAKMSLDLLQSMKGKQ